jgi:hypothetical protein
MRGDPSLDRAVRVRRRARTERGPGSREPVERRTAFLAGRAPWPCFGFLWTLGSFGPGRGRSVIPPRPGLALPLNRRPTGRRCRLRAGLLLPGLRHPARRQESFVRKQKTVGKRFFRVLNIAHERIGESFDPPKKRWSASACSIRRAKPTKAVGLGLPCANDGGPPPVHPHPKAAARTPARFTIENAVAWKIDGHLAPMVRL